MAISFDFYGDCVATKSDHDVNINCHKKAMPWAMNIVMFTHFESLTLLAAQNHLRRRRYNSLGCASIKCNDKLFGVGLIM